MSYVNGFLDVSPPLWMFRLFWAGLIFPDPTFLLPSLGRWGVLPMRSPSWCHLIVDGQRRRVYCYFILYALLLTVRFVVLRLSKFR